MLTQPSIAQAFQSWFVNFGRDQHHLVWICAQDNSGKERARVSIVGRSIGLGFLMFWLNFVHVVPASK